MKKDDSTLRPEELDNVKKHARKLLNEADALGQLPTPVDRLVSTAKLIVNQEVSLSQDESLLTRFSSNIGKIARPHLHGVKKLLGLLHVPSGEIWIDHSQHESKKSFIKLHETAHGFMPHQKKMFEFMEDGMLELDSEIEDKFEREANNFAAETLFQLDKFEKMAADYQISIKTPLDLSKKFGASVYSSMRRYIQTHFAPLALAVYDPPNSANGSSQYRLRRDPMHSPAFMQRFGAIRFPITCAESDYLGSILWNKSKLHTYNSCAVKDLNGDIHECAIHIFSNSYEKFMMIIPLKKSSSRSSTFCLN